MMSFLIICSCGREFRVRHPSLNDDILRLAQATLTCPGCGERIHAPADRIHMEPIQQIAERQFEKARAMLRPVEVEAPLATVLPFPIKGAEHPTPAMMPAHRPQPKPMPKKLNTKKHREHLMQRIQSEDLEKLKHDLD